jgi:hypothetical protein
MKQYVPTHILLVLVVLATTGVGARGQQKSDADLERADAAVSKVLAAKTDIDVVKMPLDAFVKALAQDRGIAFRMDLSGLQRAGVAPSLPITASLKQVPLGIALRQILRPLKLQYHIEHGIVIVDDLGLPLDAAHPPGIGPVGPQRVAMQPAVQQRFPARVGVVMWRAPAMGAPVIIQGGNVDRFDGAPAIQQLRLILQVELRFLKKVCAPAPEQMQHLRQEGLKQLEETAKAFHLDETPGPKDPRRLVQERLARLVRSTLSQAQALRYEAEIQKRTTSLREVCARNLVVALDQELGLTQFQRQKLCAELAANWDDSWTMTVIQGSFVNSSWLPNVPDELVLPYLDAEQRLLWNTLPKRGNTVWSLRAGAFLGMAPPAMEELD